VFLSFKITINLAIMHLVTVDKIHEQGEIVILREAKKRFMPSSPTPGFFDQKTSF